MNNRNSCDCCNCCQNCGNNSNNSGKILNNIQNSTPQMDADSWKLNGEAHDKSSNTFRMCLHPAP